MQIGSLVIQGVAIDMMDDLPFCCARNAPMLPFTASAITPKSLPLKILGRMAVRLFRACGGWLGGSRLSCASNHHVAPSLVSAWLNLIDLLFVGMERIVVVARHLIVSPAHFLGNRRAITKAAFSTNDLSAPPIISRSVLFDALVVHQTISISSMLSAAPINVANPHSNEDKQFPKNFKYKALGNAWAVACVRQIAREIVGRLAA